jgi:hypothetical protein
MIILKVKNNSFEFEPIKNFQTEINKAKSKWDDQKIILAVTVENF